MVLCRYSPGVSEQPLAEPARLEEFDGVGYVSTQPQRLHDRLDGDVDEPGSVQHGRQVLPVAQRERSGTARFIGRRQGDVLGGAGGHGDPLVVHEALPAHEHQPAAGTQTACDIGERGLGR
jgi:hypothetical protein